MSEPERSKNMIEDIEETIFTIRHNSRKLHKRYPMHCLMTDRVFLHGIVGFEFGDDLIGYFKENPIAYIQAILNEMERLDGIEP